jgi:hypothetical protein
MVDAADLRSELGKAQFCITYVESGSVGMIFREMT